MELFITHGEVMYIMSILIYGVLDMYKYEISCFVVDSVDLYKKNECAFLELVYVMTTAIQTCAIIGLMNKVYESQKHDQENAECEFPMEFPYGTTMDENKNYSYKT